MEGNEIDSMAETQKDQYLIFKLGDEDYGLDIKNVTEIIGVQPIITTPDLPEYIKGIINLRGKIIPVMDIRLRFKKEEIAYNDRTCIIVVDINSKLLGLIVDSVSEVVNIMENDIVSPPEIGETEKKFVKGIGKLSDEVKLILDCEALLGADDTNIILKTDIIDEVSK